LTLVTKSEPGPGDPLDSYVVTGGFAQTGWIGGFLFAGWEPASGHELWFSDGTAAGTLRVAGLFPGEGSSIPLWR
jgi:ELWxxDGT repeat protein